MKLAVLTDLHANREAVVEVMAHARSRGAQRHAFLGDFVGYGADPCWVVDLVREHVAQGAVAVLGNHDAAVARGVPPNLVPDARLAVEWTRSRLSTAQLEFLSALPLSDTRGEALFVHANAHAPEQWAYVQSHEQAAHSLHATACRYTFCGHVHEPTLFHLSRAGKAGRFVPLAGVTIPLSAQRRWLAIPGSAGQPRDGDPAACYAIFDDEATTITFHRVAYDFDAAGAKIRAAGLPAWLAQRLSDGL